MTSRLDSTMTRLCRPGYIVGRHAAPGFNAAMVLVRLAVLPEWPLQGASVGGGKPGLDGLGQIRLIALHIQHVVGTAPDNLLGDVVLASHGIDGCVSASNVQRLQQLRDGADLVALVSRAHLAQRQSDRAAPRRHQMNRATRAVMRAAQALAIDGHMLALQRGTQATNPAHKAMLEPAGVKQREDTAKGVVRSNAMGIR